MTKRILRTPEAAAYIGLAVSTLEKKRLTGGGPQYTKLTGRAIGYTCESLDKWIADRQRVESTSAPRAAV